MKNPTLKLYYRLKATGTGMLLALLSLNTAWASLGEKDTITTYAGNKVFIVDNQHKKMKLMVAAQLFNVECGMGDLCKFGLGVKADFFLPKLISVSGSYTRALWGMKKLEYENNITDNAYVPFSQLELGGRFHFIDKRGRAKNKIVLYSETSYGYNSTTTLEKSITTKLPCRRIWAARGGLYISSATVSTNMSKNSEVKAGTVTTKDGVQVGKDAFTAARTYGFYVGLSSIYNMRVRTKNDVPGYEDDTYINSIFREVYADIIIAGTSFDDFNINGAEHALEANGIGGFQTSALGWRVGKVLTRTRRLLNASFTFEITAVR